VLRRDVGSCYQSSIHFFLNKVLVYLNVFCPIMLYRIVHSTNSRDLLLKNNFIGPSYFIFKLLSSKIFIYNSSNIYCVLGVGYPLRYATDCIDQNNVTILRLFQRHFSNNPVNNTHLTGKEMSKIVMNQLT